jgi:protein-tyrosine phosphatase
MIAEHLGPEKVAVYEPTMVVEESYLQAAYDAVGELYGSVEGYVRDGLGVRSETLDALRARLLV